MVNNWNKPNSEIVRYGNNKLDKENSQYSESTVSSFTLIFEKSAKPIQEEQRYKHIPQQIGKYIQLCRIDLKLKSK